MSLLKKLLLDQRGQDLAEYGIALAVIAVGAGIAAVALAASVNTLWSVAASTASGAV